MTGLEPNEPPAWWIGYEEEGVEPSLKGAGGDVRAPLECQLYHIDEHWSAVGNRVAGGWHHCLLSSMFSHLPRPSPSVQRLHTMHHLLLNDFHFPLYPAISAQFARNRTPIRQNSLHGDTRSPPMRTPNAQSTFLPRRSDPHAHSRALRVRQRRLLAV